MEGSGAGHGPLASTGVVATGCVVGIRLGAIDGDPGVRPSARQSVACAALWEPIPDDGLARYDERMPRI